MGGVKLGERRVYGFMGGGGMVMAGKCVCDGVR